MPKKPEIHPYADLCAFQRLMLLIATLFYRACGNFKGSFQMVIYTPRQIAETLHFSLRCIDALQGKSLRHVFLPIWWRIWYPFRRCVDLAAETLAGHGLLDELFSLAGKTN